MAEKQTQLLVKGAIAGATAGLLDRFVLGVDSLQNNAYFGLAAGAGIAAGSFVGSMVPTVIPDGEMYKGKSVVDRGLEVGVGVGSTYVLSKYLVTETKYNSLTSKLLVVVASDFVGEYFSDYIYGRPLAILQ